MSNPIAVKLDDGTRKRLRRLGKARDRSPHWLMRTAILQYLDREEDYARQKQEDAERWEHYLLSGNAVAHDKVAEWLDSIGTANELPCPS